MRAKQLEVKFRIHYLNLSKVHIDMLESITICKFVNVRHELRALLTRIRFRRSNDDLKTRNTVGNND